MRHLQKGFLVSVLLVMFSFALPAAATHYQPQRVFTMSNAADGNEILIFKHRPAKGLKLIASVATGGNGSGGGLGNQGGLILSDDNQWMYAVNPGSDTISVFRVNPFGIYLVETVDSGGVQPVSLTQHDDLLYVVNAGSDSIAGFTVDDGRLTPLDNSVRSLSGSGTAPAQISFAPWGDMLIVTEKNTNLITTFVLDDDGTASSTVFNFSEVDTPFGFNFDRFGHLLVTQAAGGAADASAVSSYDIEDDGSLTVLDGGAATMESAACWLVTSRNGRVAFVTNTGSGTLSAFKVNRRGKLRLTTDDGISGSTGEGTAPIDMALSRNGRFLFALASGNIVTFRVLGNQHLVRFPGTDDVPGSANGLVAY